MFVELLPILRNRPLMLTISLVNDQAIRVHVIPKQLKDGDSGDCALTTPLTVTGTPEELDRELAGQLVGFTGSFVKLGSNLSEIEAAHATAVKAVEAEKKKDLDGKRKGVVSKTSPATDAAKPGPELKDGKPVFGSKTSAAGGTPTLFDSPEAASDARPITAPPAQGQSNLNAAAETVARTDQPNL
jgi:PRTRC genetic system protein E